MQLDKYQELVVQADPNANMKIVGAPGSGKTRALVSRYTHLYINCGLNPSRILVLTFSKKAADEMSKRINESVDLNRQAKNNISTINAFCYRLYNEWRVGQRMKPLKVWQFGDKATNPNFIASDLMQKHLNTSDLSVFDAINKVLKSVPVPTPDLLREIELYGVKADKAYQVWEEYEAWMMDNNLTDFYGQVWHVDQLMHQKPVFSMMIGERFDKIIGDEVQDMFPQTYRIVLKLAEFSSVELFADPSQSIYGFNGAAPHYFGEVDALVPGMETYHLSNNYRSSRNIVEVVNNFGPATMSTFSPMNCVKIDTPGRVGVMPCETISSQADYIAEMIEAEKYNYNDVYVLARTNAQCSLLHQRLTELRIPSYYASNFSIWDKKHMKAGIGYAAIMNDQDGPEDLLNILNVPSVNHTAKFGQGIGKYVPTRFLPQAKFIGKSFKDLVNKTISLTGGQRPGVSNIVKFINQLKEIDGNRARVGTIEDAIMKWAQWSGTDYASVGEDLSILWDKLENLDYNVDNLRIYIQKMDKARREIKRGMNRVQVMTIHQAKGLEAPIVFLTGLSEPIKGQHRTSGFHPGRNTNVNINEENCLYYVGISRAIEHLYLTYYIKSGEIYYNLSSFVTDFAIRKTYEQVQ